VRRNLKSVLFVLVPLAVLALGWPTAASAQHHGRGVSRVVIAPPAYLHDPFYDPWLGYQWGYPNPYPPYGGYRMAGPEASVRLDVKPRDAQVYVDGYYAGLVDEFDGALQRLHVLPGQHEIVIYKEGYRSVHERLYLSANSSRKLTHELEKLAAGEANEPVPTPAAEPQTPPSGPDGYAPPRQGRRGPSPRPGTQPPAGTAREGATGSVAIRVQPDDAEILIDGERWAGTTDDDRLVVQLNEGRHQVEVRKPGYRPVTLDVEVRRGEIAPVNVSLLPN
jgi:hypothetical protein